MKNINFFTTEKLKKDLDDLYGILLNAEGAKKLGVKKILGMSVQERIDNSKRMIQKIERELARRGEKRTEGER